MSNLHTDLSMVAVSVAPSPATSGTSLGVTDANAANLPNVYPWYAVVKPTGLAPTRSNAEIVQVTGGSSSGGTTTYTIVRAKGNPVTTARTIIVGDDIYEAVSSDVQAGNTDNTIGDVSTTAHGFAPKAPNDTTKFLRGDATYAIPLIRSKQIYATRDMTSATGDVAYTGFGFTPRHFTVVSSISGTNVASWGMSDVSGGVYGTGFVTYYTYTPAFGQSTSLGVAILNTAGATDQEGKVKTFDADGVTLTWTKNGSPTGTADLQILAAS